MFNGNKIICPDNEDRKLIAGNINVSQTQDFSYDDCPDDCSDCTAACDCFCDCSCTD